MQMILIDDEQTQIAYLAALVEGWAKVRGIDAIIRRFESAESYLFACGEDNQADILFIDIQMRAMDGVALARRIREMDERVQIVFVTGFPDYIAQGYDVSALHYLMKPVKREKLYEVLDRAVFRLSKDNTIAIQTQEGVMRMAVGEIESIETTDRHLTLHTVRGQYAIDMPLYALERELTADFVRCHRSCVVNMRRVRQVTRTQVILDSGRALPLSRRLYAEVSRAMLQHMKGADGV